MILAWLQGVLGTNLEQKKDPSEEGSKSGGPGSNRQPLAWKAKALPLSYRREHDNYTKIRRFLKGFIKKLLEKYEKNSKFTLALTKQSYRGSILVP